MEQATNQESYAMLLDRGIGLNTTCMQFDGKSNSCVGDSVEDGNQWGVTIFMMLIVFAVMETEKYVRRGLKAAGADTDDKERWVLDYTDHPEEDIALPKGASHLNLTELNK